MSRPSVESVEPSCPDAQRFDLDRVGTMGPISADRQGLSSHISPGCLALGRGAADPIPFHAFRRACRYYSLPLPFAAWWSPQGFDDMAARARTVRVQPLRSKWQLVAGMQYIGTVPKNTPFECVARKGGVGCRHAVHAMAARLARCRPVAVQRAARSHATASGSPIREEFGR